MSIAIDHVGIPAADPWASARFLAEILAEGDITPEGPDGEMVSLSLGAGSLTYFALAAHEPHHVANIPGYRAGRWPATGALPPAEAARSAAPSVTRTA